MAFSKRFPKTVPGSAYPVWEEMYLTPEEEKLAEEQAKAANLQIYRGCLAQAAQIIRENHMDYDRNAVEIANALFEKAASHVIFWKEAKCKEKFDKKQ